MKKHTLGHYVAGLPHKVDFINDLGEESIDIFWSKEGEMSKEKLIEIIENCRTMEELDAGVMFIECIDVYDDWWGRVNE